MDMNRITFSVKNSNIYNQSETKNTLNKFILGNIYKTMTKSI